MTADALFQECSPIMEAAVLHSNQDLVFTDRRGWPKMPGIHDSELKTLSLEFGKRLAFSARGVNGEQTTFVLDELHLLKIEDLWEGVVVDSVAIWRVVDGAIDDPDEGCGRAWSALLAGRVPKDGQAAEIARLKRAYDGSALVAVASSYGGELQALCRQVLINGRGVASV